MLRPITPKGQRSLTILPAPFLQAKYTSFFKTVEPSDSSFFGIICECTGLTYSFHHSVILGSAMTTKETAYQTLTNLVERFDEQKHSYKRSGYNETLARRDFIGPFFKALGWDIDHSKGYAEAYSGLPISSSTIPIRL